MSPQELESQINTVIRSVEEARRQAHRDLAKRSQLIAKLHELAKLRIQQGEFSRAESLYREALECTKDRRKIDPGEVFNIHRLLGEFYDAWGKPAEAMDYYAKALEYGEDAQLQQSIGMAELKARLGSICRASGNTEHAVEYYEQAVEAFLSSVGENDIRLASIYDELGTISYQKMELDQALKKHSKALSIYQQTHGKRDYSATYYHLNLVYRALGDFKRAFECIQSAEEIRNRVV